VMILQVGQVLAAPNNVGDTEETLSLDEKLRRERRRAYTVGITSYAWAPGEGPTGHRLVIPLQVLP
jgi:dipeptidyl-peptidase 4